MRVKSASVSAEGETPRSSRNCAFSRWKAESLGAQRAASMSTQASLGSSSW